MELMIEGHMRKIAYFIPIMERQADGWQVGIAAEGLPHFYKTDYRWDCSHEEAEELAQKLNDDRGISKQEAERIISSSVLASCRKEALT